MPTPAPASTAAPTSGPAVPPPAATVAPTRPAAVPAVIPAAAATPTAAASASRVVVMMGQQPDTLMPRLGSMAARAEVLGALQTRAVVIDDTSRPVPVGVEQVPTFENGGVKWVGEGDDRHLEVAFRVRKGLKFHDGTPVTSKDVRFAWALVMNPKVRVDDRLQEQKVNAVDTPDEQTVVFKYHSARQAREAATRGFMGFPADDFRDWRDVKDPVGDPLYYLILDWGFFLPEHILGKVEPDKIESHEFTRKPVLAGAYRLKEWVPDQTITLEAIPDYVLGAPKVATVVYRIVKDTNAQLAALLAGEVDVMANVQGVEIDRAPELDRLATQGQYKIHYVPGTPWEHVDFNLDNEHLRDRNVRKAIAHGIDRQAIVDKLLFGKSVVAHSWVQPGLPPWAWDEGSLVKYGFDPNRTKALLTESGYTAGPDGILVKSGKKLQLRIATTDAPLRKSVCQVVQQQLKAVGVGVEIEFYPGRALFENNGPLKKRNFDLALYSWLSLLNPDRIDYLHSKNIPSERNGLVGNNYMGYSNPKVDELALKGASLIDEKERRLIYLELQRIVTDDVPFLPMFQRVSPTVARTRILGFRPTPSPNPTTWNVAEWSLA